MRLEKRFVKTLDERALRAIITFRPKAYPQWRVHSAVCTIFDTGCRINEVLTARVRDFDFDNLLLTIVGKGDKQRIVPISFELRKQLIRFGQFKERHAVPAEWMFRRETVGRGTSAMRCGPTTCSWAGLVCQVWLPSPTHTAATEYLKHGDAGKALN